MRHFLALLLILILASCSGSGPEPRQKIVNPEYLARGARLVNGLAACGACHGKDSAPDSPLSGGRTFEDIYGEVNAPNITSSTDTGIGEWNTNQVMKAIRNSVGKGGTELSQQMHSGYLWMSDEDLLSIVGYIRSLPPAENEVSRRSVGFFSRNTSGIFQSRKKVAGYVPSISPNEKLAYGRYLVENVANCGFCHNSPEALFSSEGYLQGGKRIERGEAEKVAPPLNSSLASPISSWNEAQIVQYLQTGLTPEKKSVDPNFCPYNFYKNASRPELEAVAAYLKTVTAP